MRSIGNKHCSKLLVFMVIAQTYAEATIHATQAASAPIVDLGYAQYQGFSVVDTVTNATNTNFFALRYAAPPTGVHRFAAPQPPSDTPGVQMANVAPNLCLQASEGNQPTTPFRVATRAAEASGPDEDCLFLNVFVPGNLGEKMGLPVIFYIHGGGYISGGAPTAGNDLVREAGGNVIAVTVQYRLGLFGFLPGQKVKTGGALNAGLLDQQFALKWVQHHITKFGGDPLKVTIWGTSAGAGSVLQQVVANGGRTFPPLFRAAMTSSTFLPSQYKFNDRIPETVYSEVVSQTNCSSSSDTLACLRSADIAALQAANMEISNSGFFGTFVFVPVVDGTFITDRPTQLLKQGRVNGVILYSVTNAFEGTIFVDQTATDTVADHITQLFPNFTPPVIAAATSLYAGLGADLFQKNAIMGESIFICPTYYMLNAFRGLAFKGEFAIPPGLHGRDLAYYFSSDNANGIPPYSNAQFDAAFPQSFLNFVVALNPNIKWDNSNITPLFPLWTGSNEMLFNSTEAGDPDIRVIKTSSALLQRCNFWNSVSVQTAQ